MLEKILTREIITTLCSIVIGYILYKIVSKIITKFLISKIGKDRKKQTMIGIINNIVKYFFFTIVILIILDAFGVDTMALIASLGIVGLVAGLAVQDTLKDFISGVSIIFENQYFVGDIVEINGFKGEVLSLGLKTTKIKAPTGEIKILANRNISEVINYSLNNYVASITVQISYEENLEKVEKVLNKLFERLNKEMTNIKSNIELYAINNLCDSGVELKIQVECDVSDNMDVKRFLYKEIKKEFDKNKISIPYPQMVVHNG